MSEPEKTGEASAQAEATTNKFQNAISQWRGTDCSPPSRLRRWAFIAMQNITSNLNYRPRLHNISIESRQHGLGNRRVSAGLDSAEEGLGAEDKGLQEA
jgi:hypothetical protein